VRVPDVVAAPVPAAEPGEPAPAATNSTGVVTTDVEVRVRDYVRTRLPFLIAGDEELFAKLGNISSVDYKTVYCVFYKQERKGRIFNFWENRGPAPYRFEFPAADGNVSVETDNLADIDAHLLSTFRRRVEEMG
jgi:hypothetical protein